MKAEAAVTALTLLLVAAPLSAEGQAWQYPSPKEAIEQLSLCGFSDSKVNYEEVLQEDVLTLSGGANATDEQILCAAKTSIETSYQVEVPEELRERYWSVYMSLIEAEGRKIARDWLHEHGISNRIPQYDPAMADTAYAQALENFCGPNAKGALSSEYGPHALSPDWALHLRNFGTEQTGEAMMCLTSASAVSGFKVYLIGNEKVREP